MIKIRWSIPYLKLPHLQYRLISCWHIILFLHFIVLILPIYSVNSFFRRVCIDWHGFEKSGKAGVSTEIALFLDVFYLFGFLFLNLKNLIEFLSFDWLELSFIFHLFSQSSLNSFQSSTFLPFRIRIFGVSRTLVFKNIVDSLIQMLRF